MTTVQHGGYIGALLELAQEFKDGAAYERDTVMNVFPHGDEAFMSKAAHRAELFLQMSRMCQERAEARHKASGGTDRIGLFE